VEGADGATGDEHPAATRQISPMTAPPAAVA
jgi:hypothetical protein